MCLFSTPKIQDPATPTPPAPELKPMQFQPTSGDSTQRKQAGVKRLQIPMGGASSSPTSLAIPT
jgi:hypothetical protein